jgi:hypothetical protein
VLTAAVVVAAIAGYLLGHGRAHSATNERILTASADGVLLNYPSSWSTAATLPEVPGLTLTQPFALAPGGDSAKAGLIAGRLAGGEPSPLPQTLVALLHQAPLTEVVNLLGNQAYRYSHVSVTGFPHALTLYAIPNPTGSGTALACYASSPLATDMLTCEHIATTLTLVDQSQSYDLTPDPTYARELSAAITTLDHLRVALRGEMGAGATRAALRQNAKRLAAAFASTAASLAPLQPTLAVNAADSALSASVLRARAAYATLAAAAQTEDTVRLTSARRKVYEAEASVDSALESFALLGYKQS